MDKTELKLEVDVTVLQVLADSGIDPGPIAEAALVMAARARSDEKKATAWAAENAQAIQAHRERIEKYGVFGEDLRTW